ncbi:hypothetical protein MTR_2g045380 [Medicago truncatula]|uniref:Uncharacterized protein n=1 Tax=Medicago truncatula TaxID=3880 RepID=G7IQG2_MEDTR|nr:hypothetical protein MTR_2g045380 [Medicago truncatula]
MEYNVIFNGDRIGPIVPELGLQQGRPFRIDDSFIFGKVTTAEAQRLKDILIHYECSSDQAINDGKFAISFCANTLHDTIVVISNSLVVCGQLVVVNIWDSLLC